jgi:hypothetical protein
VQRISAAAGAAAGTAEDEEAQSRATRTFDEALGRFKMQHLDAAYDAARKELAEAESRGEDVSELQRQVSNLTRRKHELKRPSPSS